LNYPSSRPLLLLFETDTKADVGVAIARGVVVEALGGTQARPVQSSGRIGKIKVVA